MIYQILYALFCILFAWINRNMINNGKKIRHGVNGLIHLCIAAFIAYKTNIWSGVASLFLARVVFDWSLNLFRFGQIDYVPLNPKSIIDKIEKRLFGLDGVTPKLVYLFIWVVLNNIR